MLVGSGVAYILSGRWAPEVALVVGAGTTIGMMLGALTGTRWPRRLMEAMIGLVTLGSAMWMLLG